MDGYLTECEDWQSQCQLRSFTADLVGAGSLMVRVGWNPLDKRCSMDVIRAMSMFLSSDDPRLCVIA